MDACTVHSSLVNRAKLFIFRIDEIKNTRQRKASSLLLDVAVVVLYIVNFSACYLKRARSNSEDFSSSFERLGAVKER